MTASDRHEGTTTELLARMDAMEQKHRGEIEALTTAMHQQQIEISTLKAHTAGTSTRRVLPASPKSRLAAKLSGPFSGRGKRIGVGLSLALLLLVAPSQSGMTYAANEGVSNTAYGQGSLPGGTGTGNAAFGVHVLNSNTTGYNNAAVGADALRFNTTGSQNTASGALALSVNTTGGYNTASGFEALYLNTTGHDNAASGAQALYANDTGANNTASGSTALYSNTSGSNNTASGSQSLHGNTTGDENTASGSNALYANSSGFDNTASGLGALSSNSTGSYNTAIGVLAGSTTNALNANTTGSNNTFIGYNSGPGTSSEINNATAIGSNAIVAQSNSIVLGGTGENTQRVGVGTTTPHSAFQIAKGFLQLRPITGEPAAAQCATADDAGRLVVRTDGNINLYVCNGTSWIGK